MNSYDLIENKDLGRIAKKGEVIYGRFKHKYEKKSKGKYLAIDTESEDLYLASTSAEAVVAAKKEHPDNIFYVVKVGYDATESIASMFYRK